MRRYPVTEGTRDEILAELNRAGLDQTPRNQTKADELGEAWREVRDGATWVEACGAVYRVVEG